jgi:glutamyl-tRNA synthetase
MHLGNVYAALISWLSVKKKGGVWVLRIEDLDPQRCKLEYALQLEDDLRWFGLDWDEGGTENRGNCGPYLQSQRSEIYEEYLQRLNKTGLTYPCTCTRADIMATQAPHESDGRIVYKGTCRPQGMPKGTPTLFMKDQQAATRLYVPDKQIAFTDGHYGAQSVNLATHCGDFVLRRKDGAWAYQLAVVVDDALMGITEVVRGRDLLL